MWIFRATSSAYSRPAVEGTFRVYTWVTIFSTPYWVEKKSWYLRKRRVTFDIERTCEWSLRPPSQLFLYRAASPVNFTIFLTEPYVLVAFLLFIYRERHDSCDSIHNVSSIGLWPRTYLQNTIDGNRTECLQWATRWRMFELWAWRTGCWRYLVTSQSCLDPSKIRMAWWGKAPLVGKRRARNN